MIAEPWFWRDTTLAARALRAALAPAALVYDCGQRLRWATTRPAPAPAPVFCVGNVTLGGVGKTPFALMLGEQLTALGAEPHFLSRGYGGALKGPVQVDPSAHSAADVGDEALLLAATLPAWVSRSRPAGARAAAAAGARSIIMDDGFQNPTLEKTVSFLLFEAHDAQRDQAIFPAGPLRESMARALARADCIAHIFKDRDAARRSVAQPSEKPAFRGWLEPVSQAPRRVAAFCGIGAPDRFFAMLEASGFEIASRVSFPDHHPFTVEEVRRLRSDARKAGAALITTAKDFVRLAADLRDDIDVLRVAMRIDDPARLDRLLKEALDRFARERRGS